MCIKLLYSNYLLTKLVLVLCVLRNTEALFYYYLGTKRKVFDNSTIPSYDKYILIARRVVNDFTCMHPLTVQKAL